MKKQSVYLTVCGILLAVALQFFVSPLSFAVSAGEYAYSDVAVMPEALIRVEEGAFAGTSFRKILFGEGFRYVGDLAFSDMELLREVTFPRSADYIADSAFLRSDIEIIRGPEGAYAQQWAKRHQIAFETSDCLITTPTDPEAVFAALASLFAVVLLPMNNEAVRIKRYLRSTAISMRPQDRPELDPIDYRFP